MNNDVNAGIATFVCSSFNFETGVFVGGDLLVKFKGRP